MRDESAAIGEFVIVIKSFCGLYDDYESNNHAEMEIGKYSTESYPQIYKMWITFCGEFLI